MAYTGLSDQRLDAVLFACAVAIVLWNRTTGCCGPTGSLVCGVRHVVGATSDVCNPAPHKSSSAFCLCGLFCWGDVTIRSARELGENGIPRFGRLSEVNVTVIRRFGITEVQLEARGMIP